MQKKLKLNDYLNEKKICKNFNEKSKLFIKKFADKKKGKQNEYGQLFNYKTGKLIGKEDIGDGNSIVSDYPRKSMKVEHKSLIENNIEYDNEVELNPMNLAYIHNQPSNMAFPNLGDLYFLFTSPIDYLIISCDEELGIVEYKNKAIDYEDLIYIIKEYFKYKDGCNNRKHCCKKYIQEFLKEKVNNKIKNEIKLEIHKF